MSTHLDFSFGLAWQSKTVLAMLEEFSSTVAVTGNGRTLADLHSLRIITRPFYNGREKGVCLVVTHKQSSKCLFVYFANVRNGDGLFMLHCTGDAPPDGPTIRDFTDEAWRQRQSYEDNELVEAAEHICKIIGRYYREETDGFEVFEWSDRSVAALVEEFKFAVLADEAEQAKYEDLGEMALDKGYPWLAHALEPDLYLPPKA